MKISIARDQLVKALERCDAVADPKGTHPHTGKVLLTASAEGGTQVLQAYCTDLKLQVDTAVPCTVEQAGSVAVDCKRLLSATRAMPAGSINVALRTGRLVVTCAGSRQYGLPTVDATAFPTPSEPRSDAKRFALPSDVLSSLVGRVQQSVAADGRANLDGVFIDLEDGVLNVVVVGSHTIAIARERNKHPEPQQWKALLPTFMLKSVLAVCHEHDEVTLALDGPTVYAETADTLVGALLPRDPFVPWRNGVKGLTRARVARVPAIVLREAVHAIMVARQDRGSPIRLWLRKDKLEVALVGEECSASDEIPVEVLDQPELRTLMQPSYLLETVRGADADFVLEQDSQGPIIVSTDDYLGLISPISPEAWPGAFDPPPKGAK